MIIKRVLTKNPVEHPVESVAERPIINLMKGCPEMPRRSTACDPWVLSDVCPIIHDEFPAQTWKIEHEGKEDKTDENYPIMERWYYGLFQ
jgi:hypothetical protein